ncbi:MAG: DUF975 family protein [Ruminococcaceae bacterium]|nr:DUF975 family protein [Oscillospiraceae bacterium]
MKFDRKLLKTNAKTGLKRYYWLALLVTVVHSVLAGGSSGGVSSSSGSANMQVNQESIEYSTGSFSEAMESFSESMTQSGNEGMMAVIGIVAVVIFLAGLAWSLFIASPITVGKNSFFLESRQKEAKFGYLFNAFKNNYMKTVGSMFTTNLIIAAYSLLVLVPVFAGMILALVTENAVWAALILLGYVMVIPLIIKSYQYLMVPYILAENPGMSGKEARAMSTAMTNGYKMDLFVLGLSFFPWILLGMLACCVGVVFVAPYIEATNAEAYCFLKANYQLKNPTAMNDTTAAAVEEATATAAVAAAPVVEEVAPVVEEAAPVAEEAAPVVEEAASVAEEVAPVAEEAAPVVEEAAPVVEEAAESVDEAADEAAAAAVDAAVEAEEE